MVLEQAAETQGINQNPIGLHPKIIKNTDNLIFLGFYSDVYKKDGLRLHNAVAVRII
jgi:hypothetical protein